MNNIVSSSAFADSRQHYALLDGLRGVAAMLVVLYHVFEGFAFAGQTDIVFINHGYLSVDFFFILSGFVISYAYDSRWATSLSMKGFVRRRLIRLHPMVVLGAVVGAVTFCIQGSEQWDGTHVATSMLMLALLCAMFFVPAIPGCCYEVRGNGELFPLNGPSWSLFFEYIGNIIYAIVLRRLSNAVLAVVVVVIGLAWAAFAVFDFSGYGMIGVGWTFDLPNMLGGTLRMLFPFTLGMLVQRNFKPWKVRGAFWIAAALLAPVMFVPIIPQTIAGSIHLNGLFELACVAVLFPIVVRIGASGVTTDHTSSLVCKFLGDISFPLYIVHYPFMYLFYSWLIKNQVYDFAGSWPLAIGVYVWNVLFAYLCLKFYDEPLRRWLSRRFK